MSIQIRPIYMNPLTMIKGQGPGVGQRIIGQRKPSDKVRELQLRQQQLQNEILLRKAAGSDSGGISPEQQNVMEKKLEELSAELRAAKADHSEDAVNEQKTVGQQLSPLDRAENADIRSVVERASCIKRNRDIYEKSMEAPESAGLYQLKLEEGKPYSISFLRYEERQ